MAVALRLKRPSALPGFGIALGYTLTYLGLIVLLPLAVLMWRAAGIGVSGFVDVATDPRVLAALWTSFGLSFAAATVASVFGFLTAWVLTRYTFPGRRFVDAAVDLPFALPTAVAGIALAALYAPNGWIGGLVAPLGMKIAFTKLGIFIALVFVALPFAVRTMQPLIAEIDRELEEASATLGASRLETVVKAIVPPLLPGLLTGFVLSFSRAVGEYGSVVFVAGNLPYVSEIAPLLIVIKLEEYDYAGATAIATIMLIAAFASLLLINLLEAYARRRFGQV
ncbi:MAG TPA: sulfate ABC transporter permease subunit CysT [Enterovirga sp.]